MHAVSSRWRKPQPKRSKQNSHLAAARQQRVRTRAIACQTDPVGTQPNQHEEEQQEQGLATPKGRTGRKFSLFNVTQELSEADDYILMSVHSLRGMVKGLSCNACKQNSLVVKTSNPKGFAFTIFVVCESCGEVHSQSESSPRIVCKDSTRPPFEANRKMVEAFIRSGGGYNAMLKFGTIVGINVMDQSTYRDHMQKLVIENEALKEEILSRARQAVRKHYEDEDPTLKDEDIIEVFVSFDGSWHRRGRTSNYGFVSVIEVDTGLVIDFETLSKYCHICCVVGAEMGTDSPEYLEWYEKHIEIGECCTNFSGASGNMEREGAVIIWKRSEQDAKMRYTKFISDGDAKSLAAIQEAQPYGPDIQIEKDECINHVGKRLGTGLRNLVADFSKKKITLGGKKPGALTQVKIDKLQGYYQKAIIENTSNLDNMKNAILAPVHHYASTDQKPMHQYCPKGGDSWCFYQKGKAANKRKKPSHSAMKTTINKQVFDAVLPVYKRLSDPELLKKCQSGLTQNANESLHNVIWSKVPKTTFVGKGRFDLGVTQAVGEFNMGVTSLMAVQAEVTERPNSAQSMRNAEKIDRKRLAQSERESSVETKKKRSRRKKQKKNKGPDRYEPGGGD